MLNLSLNELKQIAKMRRIKGYKSMSKEKLLSALESADSRNNFNNIKIKKIREDFNKKDWFLNPKIKEIRRNLYKIEFFFFSESNIKETEQNLIELKKKYFKAK